MDAPVAGAATSSDDTSDIPTLTLPLPLPLPLTPSDLRGSTTEPDTPPSASAGATSRPLTPASPNSASSPTALYARLVPINGAARDAVEATIAAAAQSPLEFAHHTRFISTTTFNTVAGTPCFEISLANPPEFAHMGWRIGSGRRAVPGRRELPNRGVDLLLLGGEGVAGIHARLNWVRGAGGFFLIADNKRGAACMVNGEVFAHDARTVPFRNALLLGECVFTLRYVQRAFEDEEQFGVELREYFAHTAQLLDGGQPLILPTPGESQTVIGEWCVHFPISRGAYGIVHMVTHQRDGRPAALKQLLKFERNGPAVDREVRMAKRVAKLSHPRIASPFEIHHQRAQTAAELARLRALLDTSFSPAATNATDLYTILSPLLSATFKSLFSSRIPVPRRTVFFAQLLEGIAFLHSEGICHRDIKPDNVLVNSYDPPDIRITDFGSASDARRISYDYPGTVPYLAPEQRPGLTHGFPVDYWACALVGVQLIGCPRRGSSQVLPGPSLAHYHRFCDDAGGRSPVAVVCRGMLEVDPDRRLTAREGHEYLRGFVDADRGGADSQERALRGKRSAEDVSMASARTAAGPSQPG